MDLYSPALGYDADRFISEVMTDLFLFRKIDKFILLVVLLYPYLVWYWLLNRYLNIFYTLKDYCDINYPCVWYATSWAQKR